MSFFEGSEKKIEVVVDLPQGDVHSLLDLDRSFWERVVLASRAQILSELKSKECVAYLLSESSLFVWKNKFTMITCGQTTLAQAFLEFHRQMGSERIQSLIYERKNEIYPEEQLTSFFDDVESFQNIFQHKGQVFHFGSKSEHFIELYEYHNRFHPPEDDTTIELLMYDISKEAQSIFCEKLNNIEKVRNFIGFSRWANKFRIDDFMFEPQGYSVNALYEEQYFTIHVTPQDEGSYVSFETNIKDIKVHKQLIESLVKTFQPLSYDILDFKNKEQDFVSHPSEFYKEANQKHNDLMSGYVVNYIHMKSTSERDKML